MTDGRTEIGHSEAQAMLDAFASRRGHAIRRDVDDPRRREGMVSARREPCRSWPHPARDARQRHPPSSATSSCARMAPAFRSFSSTTSRPPCLARLAPAVFLALQTSPGNFQAWVAIERSRGQGFCPPPSQGHRSRRDRQRRNARRRQPQFQGQVRAGFSARRHRAGAAGPKDDSRRTRTARPGRSAGDRRPPCVTPARSRPRRRQPQMAGLCALRGRRAAQQRQERPRHQPRGFCVVHDRDHWGWSAGGDGGAADGGKQQGAGERRRLCRPAPSATPPPPSSAVEGSHGATRWERPSSVDRGQVWTVESVHGGMRAWKHESMHAGRYERMKACTHVGMNA